MPAFPKFKTIITDYGKQRLIAAMSPGGTKLTLTQMAVGDGGGNPTNPDTTSTALVNEVWRAAVNSVSVDKTHSNIIIVELLIPAEVGGFWVREAGIYDEFNKLVAICSLPASEKPLLEQGSGRAQTVRMTLIVSDTSIVNITIDSTTIMATNEYVDNSLEEHEKSRNHPDATLTDKGFTKLYSGVTSIDETMAATPKAVKIAMDNASARLAKERNLADLTNIPLARQSLQLGNSATLNVGTTANTVAAGDDSRITGAMQKSQNGADIPNKPLFLQNVGLEETINLAKNAVPATRRVNNKPLSGDITLWAADVKAISADTVGEITDNGTMASANTPGWWRVAVSNPDTVADFPTWPDGSKLYGYGYLFVEKFGNTWFQHYYAHRGANAKRQDWGSVPNTSRPWIIDYNTENKPSAGEVGAVSAGGGDYNHTFRLGAVGTLGDEYNPVQLISAAANQAADNFVAWTSYTWYQDYVRTGVVRAGDTTIKSFAVEINGVRFLEIGRDGTLLNGNMASDLRLGQEESISMSIPGYGQSVDCVVPSGCYVTGLTSTSTGSYIGTTKIFYRRLQRKVAGNWVDASWL
ncbi:phage tail protein [Salmonella enterica]|nr:phage tail protein [Salmonella enterica]EDY8125637.1 phage tail protein [Salmonella enterica]